MTAFGLSIYLIVRARKGLTSLPIMLEESNETIFQMKDAMYFFFKELQLNIGGIVQNILYFMDGSLSIAVTFIQVNK